MELPEEKPGLLRRFAVMFYELLILLALMMMATAALMPVTRAAIVTDNLAYQIYLLAIIVGYFSFFWIRRGRTLPMQTWHLRLVRFDRRPLTAIDALRRLLYSLLSWLPLGLGYFWVLFDKDKLAWHDHLSRTCLVLDTPQKDRAAD